MKLRDKVQHFLVVVLSRVGLKNLLLTAPGGYLRDSGWTKSARAGYPLDTAGRSQPWLTLPAICFLGDRLSADLTVFEFGSGGSTAWYGRHAGRVTSVEHDESWFEKIKNDLPSNVELVFCGTEQPGEFLDLVFRPLGDPLDYVQVLRRASAERYPDVVVIDGVDRLNCIAAVAAEAPDSTAIVVDNLEYENELAPAIELLATKGYRRLDFWGIAPGGLRLSDTAIFYKVGNSLGI